MAKQKAIYNVSDENMRKVEFFFINKMKELGTNVIEATVKDIALESGVALATAHKAIGRLEYKGVLKVNRPDSRRFAITYQYVGDDGAFEEAISQEDQIKNLQEQVEELKAEIESLRAENIQLRMKRK